MAVGFSPRTPGALPDLEGVVAALAADAARHDADGSFPHQAFDLLHQRGVLDLLVPAELGGGGAGLEVAARVLMELGRGDPSVALVTALHLLQHAQMAAPGSVWPPEERRRIQRSVVEGPALVNALRVEPELGTPARGGMPATVARRLPDGAGFSLHGRKIYSTGAPGLRWLLVYACTDDERPLVGQLVVDTAAAPNGAGWRIEPTWNHLGMRATASHDIVFDGVAVPAEAALDFRPADDPAPVDPLLMGWNALLIAATYHGVALAARDWLVGYLHRRVPSGLGRSLATLPRFQEAVGGIEARVRTSTRLLIDTARRVDGSGDPHDGHPERVEALADAAMVKWTVTNAAIASVSEAVALVGNPGLSRNNDLERHLRNVLCSRIHTPQDDTILAGAGRSALAAYQPEAAGQ
ncbi:MAG: acyl-CoA dehydrogenase family protein [Acidimicrobiales bacterium]